jgi:TatA/E family protein of Tat protein translocase
MPTPGPLELVIILVIALLILGPGRLPDVGSALGKSLREFRKASSDIQDAVKVDTSPLPPDETAAAQTPAPPPAVAAAPIVAAAPAPVATDAPVAAPAATPAPTPTPAIPEAPAPSAPSAPTEGVVAAPAPAGPADSSGSENAS